MQQVNCHHIKHVGLRQMAPLFNSDDRSTTELGYHCKFVVRQQRRLK